MSQCLPWGNFLSIPGVHLPGGIGGYDGCMDLQAIRKRRLFELIAEAGSQIEVAKRLDRVRPGSPKMEPNYISRLKSSKKGSKAISGDMARDLEIAFNKPAGWMSTMDSIDDDGPGSSATEVTWPLSVPIETFLALNKRMRDEIDDAFTKMVLGAQAQELISHQNKRGQR